MRVRKDVLEQAKALLLLEQHHLQLARQQRAQLAQLLKTANGIDIVNDHWNLDVSTGRLSQEGGHADSAKE